MFHFFPASSRIDGPFALLRLYHGRLYIRAAGFDDRFAQSDVVVVSFDETIIQSRVVVAAIKRRLVALFRPCNQFSSVKYALGWRRGVVVSVVQRSRPTSGPVSTWMGDRLQAGIPSRYVTSQLGQLSLASLRGRSIEYHAASAGVKAGI